MISSLNGFRGADEITINDIKDLYEDIADKVYIVTSGKVGMDLLMNDLKNQFQKLYKNLHVALSRWVQPTSSGGSFKIPIKNNHKDDSTYFYSPVKVTTNMWYKL